MRRLLRFSGNNFTTLKGNSAHQLAAKHALSIYRSKAVYSFIPKNACSTLRLTLAIENGCVRGPDDINWIHHNNETFAASLSELLTADYSFVILRDPFARLASLFLDKFVSFGPEAWDFFVQGRRKVPMAELTFRKFVSTLKPIFRGNIHWRPQVDFLVYEEYDDYFCLEEFDAAIRKLKERIDLDVIDARPLTLHGLDHLKRLDDGKQYSDTPALDLAVLRRDGFVPQLSQMYDQDIIDIVSDLYEDDIRFYREKTGRDVSYSK